MASTFRSTHHPGEKPRGLVYMRRLAGPIGACTLPIMIGATASALQGHPVWGYLVWGLPLALVVASTWTQFTLSRTTAELHLRTGQCAVRSVHDVLSNRALDWQELYGVQESAVDVELSFGWTTLVCRREEWPEFAALKEAATRAHRASDPSTADPSVSVQF